MASTAPYKTGAGQRYRVRWRCSAGFCAEHPRGGEQHSKTFNRSKDAKSFETDKTSDELKGQATGDERVGTETLIDRPDALTFGEFAGLYEADGRVRIREDEGWFARYRSQVETTSYQSRKDRIKHLQPLLNLRIDKVTAARVDELVSILANEHPRTAKVVMETIRMILRNARLHDHKVDEKVFLSKKEGGVATPNDKPKEKTFLTFEQVERVAATLAEGTLYHLIWFVALTGLRQKEVFGLTDRHLVWDGRKLVKIHVTRDITKSDAGVRTIPLPAQAREHLPAALMQRRAGALHVFSGARGGGRLNKSWFSRKMSECREEIRSDMLRLEKMHPDSTTPYDDVSLHDFRHTFASWQIEADINPKALQKLMGHESWQVTMDVYGHLFPEALDVAMEKFQRFVVSKAA